MKKPEKNSLWLLEAMPALLIVLAAASYKLFERCIIYHDEIINLNKANISWFLDYALRPLYYASNIAAIHLLGNQWESLVVASLLYVMCYVGLVFFIIHRFFKKNFLITMAAFCLIGNSLFFREALATMPHSFSALMATISICIYFIGSKNEPRYRAYSVLWGAFLGIAQTLLLLAHPTMISVLSPLVALLLYDLIVAFRRKQETWSSVLFSASSLVFSAMTFMVVNFVYLKWNYYHNGYFHYWIEGLTKVSSLEFSKYHHPYSFYFLAVLENYKWLFIWAGLLLLPLIGYRRRITDFTTIDLEAPLKAIFIALSALAVLSLSEWKFLRVLSALLPVLVLGITGILALIISVYERQYGEKRLTNFLYFSLLLAVILPAVNHYRASVNDSLQFWAKKRHVYTEFYKTLTLLDGDHLCYPGKESDQNMRRMIVQARAAGKELLRIKPPAEESDLNVILSENRCPSIVAHKQDYEASVNLSLWLKQAGYHVQRTYLKQFDLWTRGAR